MSTESASVIGQQPSLVALLGVSCGLTLLLLSARQQTDDARHKTDKPQQGSF